MITLTEEQQERGRFLAFKHYHNDEAMGFAHVALQEEIGDVPSYVRFFISTTPVYKVLVSDKRMGELFTGKDDDVVVGAYVFGPNVHINGWAFVGEIRLRECETDSSNLAELESLIAYSAERE